MDVSLGINLSKTKFMSKNLFPKPLWDSYLIYFPKVISSYCNPRKYLEISKPFFFFWMIATNQTFHCYQTLGDRFYSQKNGKPIVCIWYDPLLILLEPHFC